MSVEESVLTAEIVAARIDAGRFLKFPEYRELDEAAAELLGRCEEDPSRTRCNCAANVATRTFGRSNEREKCAEVNSWNKEHAVETYPQIPADNRILFFKRDRELFEFLSNFVEAPVVIDGETWRSSEFYYQAQKSSDMEYRDAIRNAKTADHAKRLARDPRHSRKARKNSWFTGRVELIRPDWTEARLSILERAVRAKFTQNPELQSRLLATGDAEIIEDSTHDAFWGIGRDGLGANNMGRLLVLIRNELRSAAEVAQS